MKKTIFILVALAASILASTSIFAATQEEKENLLKRNLEQQISQDNAQRELLIKTAAERIQSTQKAKARKELCAAIKNFPTFNGSRKEIKGAFNKLVLVTLLPKEVSLAIAESLLEAHPELLQKEESNVPPELYEEFLKLTN